ncbi:F0F1 ATP synthase subunit delta [Legionella londiniensis]|uniref:ATP synthase subunit delta n=1 Tax=Legionella londiniensis TaxID=45068 RepID=A0A0W0VIJ3_9GAMM|nr:F0F1 ATP synthase subunit delta [Legionella londiniensis]KTD19561.1 ATP synthase F1 subunit delta [Legionella londiniensis]STX92217.1 ATP synthase F1 subunit delta [Legionella londiniensis]
MSDTMTLSRPYAQAVFEHALANQQLPLWSAILHDLAYAVLDPKAKRLLSDPTVTIELKCQLLLSIFKEPSRPKTAQELPVVENLIRLLAENKRLMALPDMYAQYEALRAEQEKTLEVHVSSFSALSPEQQNQLVQSLSQRLQRQITLKVDIDKTLLGGAIIRAGDLVIDGSVRGQLNKLGTSLAA